MRSIHCLVLLCSSLFASQILALARAQGGVGVAWSTASAAIALPSSSFPSCGNDAAAFVASSGAAARVGAGDGGGACSRATGDSGGNGILDDETRDIIRRFLHRTNEAADLQPFHIQGWRWHCMSLIRDAKRLERLSGYLATLTENAAGEKAGFDALYQATGYVINFNMAGLFRIQSNMFVSFLRKHLCEETSLARVSQGGSNNSNLVVEADAFRNVIETMENYRIRSEDVGKELVRLAASQSCQSSQCKQKLLDDVVQSSRQLVDLLTSMRSLQEEFIVPAISSVVLSKVQKAFNNKVLLNLGLLESRVHLVGMHDAVWELEDNDDVERIKFEREIPYVARVMIERWRDSLYRPKAGALDFGLTDDNNTKIVR